MKQLLAGIDFSEYSLHAMDYAVTLARKMDAGITMLWVNRYGPEVIPGVECQMKDLVKHYSPSLPEGRITYKLLSGRIYLELSRMAEETHADYLIIGVHGASGYDPFWLGSNAHRIISHAACPVLTINKDVPVSDQISNILLPIDNSENTRQKLPAAIEFARTFNAGITVLGVHTSTLSNAVAEGKAYVNEVIKFLDDNNIHYEQAEVHRKKYADSVLEYASQNKVDLIVTTSVQEAEETVMLGKNDYKIIHRAKTPVISIHPKLINPLVYSNIIGNYD